MNIAFSSCSLTMALLNRKIVGQAGEYSSPSASELNRPPDKLGQIHCETTIVDGRIAH